MAMTRDELEQPTTPDAALDYIHQGKVMSLSELAELLSNVVGAQVIAEGKTGANVGAYLKEVLSSIERKVVPALAKADARTKESIRTKSIKGLAGSLQFSTNVPYERNLGNSERLRQRTIDLLTKHIMSLE